MPEITLASLKELSVKVEEWTDRYDVEESVYRDLLLECEGIQRFIGDNPAHFQSQEEHNEAYCLSCYIIICLLARINEMNESDD